MLFLGLFLLLTLFTTGLFMLVFEWFSRSRLASTQTEDIHNDSQILADIAQDVLGFPSGVVVKSRFARLKHLSRGEMYLQEVLKNREESYATVVARMEARFSLVDARLFQIKQMFSRIRFEGIEERLNLLMQSHQKKFSVLIQRVELLTEIENQTRFIKEFLDLNETILAYQDQVQAQISEISRMLAPDSWAELNGVSSVALASQIR
ncbi:MAG: hypothetical protein H3C47_07865 [Candidatus Cloacimonetes bacterium]|nr:hypothetical protein [Candidatus Cloacimonadota bacterium]